ncbi:hypothetical protein AB4Z37_09375 [Bradyrhizobium sp. 2TAF24]
MPAFSDARVQDPKVRALRRKIVVRADPALDVEAARVTLRTVDGREHATGVDHARGGLERPLTDMELERKFERLVSSQMSHHAQRALVDRIWTLEHVVNVAEILPLASPGG